MKVAFLIVLSVYYMRLISMETFLDKELIQAAQNGDSAKIDNLIKVHQKNPNLIDKNDITIWCYALCPILGIKLTKLVRSYYKNSQEKFEEHKSIYYKKSRNTVLALLKNGTDPNVQAKRTEGDFGALDYALYGIADIDTFKRQNCEGISFRYGMVTKKMFPVYEKIAYTISNDIIHLLLEHKADPLQQDRVGWTPLFIAIQRNAPKESITRMMLCSQNLTVRTQDSYKTIFHAMAESLGNELLVPSRQEKKKIMLLLLLKKEKRIKIIIWRRFLNHLFLQLLILLFRK